MDFINEAKNAQRTAEFVISEPSLAERVYIPKVYDEWTTKRVMTAEWIDGVRLSDREGIRRLMGEREPGPSAPSPMEPSTQSLQFPTLKGGVKSIMQTMVDLFSAQMFSWGWVHCDPHPGNVIIRPHPTISGAPQLVLLDHGLYVGLTEEFRHNWAALWKGMLVADFDAVSHITQQWGVGTPNLFASAVLMRPVKLNKKKSEASAKEGNQLEDFNKLSNYEQSVRIKAKLKQFLTDTDRMPKELIFLLRNMR